jgi:hypothetical protein
MRERKWVKCFRAVMWRRAKVTEEADHAARHMVARSLGRKRAVQRIIFMYRRIADCTMIG